MLQKMEGKSPCSEALKVTNPTNQTQLAPIKTCNQSQGENTSIQGFFLPKSGKKTPSTPYQNYPIY